MGGKLLFGAVLLWRVSWLSRRKDTQHRKVKISVRCVALAGDFGPFCMIIEFSVHDEPDVFVGWTGYNFQNVCGWGWSALEWSVSANHSGSEFAINFELRLALDEHFGYKTGSNEGQGG